MTGDQIMNWDNPAERLALIQRVGVAEYERPLRKHREQGTPVVENGHAIRPVQCGYGRVFAVEGVDVAFATLDGAKAHARTLPDGPKKRP